MQSKGRTTWSAVNKTLESIIAAVKLINKQTTSYSGVDKGVENDDYVDNLNMRLR